MSNIKPSSRMIAVVVPTFVVAIILQSVMLCVPWYALDIESKSSSSSSSPALQFGTIKAWKLIDGRRIPIGYDQLSKQISYRMMTINVACILAISLCSLSLFVFLWSAHKRYSRPLQMSYFMMAVTAGLHINSIITLFYLPEALKDGGYVPRDSKVGFFQTGTLANSDTFDMHPLAGWYIVCFLCFSLILMGGVSDCLWRQSKAQHLKQAHTQLP